MIIERFANATGYVYEILLKTENYEAWDQLKRFRNFAAHSNDPTARKKALNLWHHYADSVKRKYLRSPGKYMASKFASNKLLWHKEPRMAQKWLNSKDLKGGSRGTRRGIFYVKFLRYLANELLAKAPTSSL